ncbi:24342_t:CDS:2 [Gigaspora rosea]|nr:24342_t:CDS:2 [Gigaspora rosea]
MTTVTNTNAYSTDEAPNNDTNSDQYSSNYFLKIQTYCTKTFKHLEVAQVKDKKARALELNDKQSLSTIDENLN